MPYVSSKQRAFFHSPGAAKAGITKKDVKHWDNASRGQRGLPEHVTKKKEAMLAAFADEVCEILSVKQANMELLSPLIRAKFGPEIHEKLQAGSAKSKSTLHKVVEFMDKPLFNDPRPSFTQRMEAGQGI